MKIHGFAPGKTEKNIWELKIYRAMQILFYFKKKLKFNYFYVEKSLIKFRKSWESTGQP